MKLTLIILVLIIPSIFTDFVIKDANNNDKTYTEFYSKLYAQKPSITFHNKAGSKMVRINCDKTGKNYILSIF